MPSARAPWTLSTMAGDSGTASATHAEQPRRRARRPTPSVAAATARRLVTTMPHARGAPRGSGERRAENRIRGARERSYSTSSALADRSGKVAAGR